MDLNVRDAAAIFEVSEAQIDRWVAEDGLPARRVDGRDYFNRTELLEWATVRRVRFRPDLFRQSPRSEGLVEALEVGGVIADVSGADKAAVLRAAVDRMNLPKDFDRSMLLQLFLTREAAGSTAIGGGIAIPHPRQPVVLPVGKPSLTLCFLNRPVDFGAADHRAVETLFVLISPTIRAHLRMLARVVCALGDDRLRAALARKAPRDEIMNEFARIESTFDQPAGGGD